ncbi:Zn(II)2Cys6 transcription factor [Aspergillus homomorphus CBS 101889]|uniref:Zn(2)-C6 fungal-type domain-containing protein n=1 Tax=Aspergillus homomorphus (strain CBS 101889) TaxID=1450537 RepID=A0A395HIL7_ASPHC|nr:hypothetical protein BO97DRAFT_378714 [Aspergillus homomorphus CBS 101889]RAL07349.1 hypothetical protein BO97DRAFT_378714 [Aspergillus homomorphus CBS 101889]
MVFPGKLSSGCVLCRKRKVKCDEGKPGCKRCITHGVPCPGYTDSFAFRGYEVANGELTGKLKVVRKARSIDSSPREPKQKKQDFAKVEPTGIPASVVSDDCELMSLCYFNHHHVLRVQRSPCEGHLAFFPDLFQERGDEPCFKHAVLSVSYLTLFHKARVHMLQINARRHYGLALRLLNQALSFSQSQIRDEIFAASLFLSMFSDLSGEGTATGSLNPHIPGIYSLMQLRGIPSRRDKYSRRLCGWAYTQMQVQAMIRREFRYACMPSAFDQIAHPCTVIRSSILTGRLSDFCMQVSDARRTSLSSVIAIDSLHALLDQACNLLIELHNWQATIPDHWRNQYESSTLSPSEQSDPDTPESHSTRDPWTTCFLAGVQAAQISFYQQFLDCWEELRYLQGAHASLPELSLMDLPDDPVMFLLDGMSYQVSVICATVTSTLGQFDAYNRFVLHEHAKLANGYTLLWPMWVVVNCPFSAPDEVLLCRAAIESVGSTMGYKLALSLIEPHRVNHPIASY